MKKLIIIALCLPILLLTSSAYAAPNPCLKADLNHDGQVNITDLSILLNQFGGSSKGRYHADLNRDGIVNITDLSILLHYYGQTCKDL